MSNQIRAAFVYITNDEKVLLLQEGGMRARGLWSLPGGHVDDGESLEQAAIREALEESGYTVTLEDILYKTELPALDYKGSPKDTGQVALTIFKAHIRSGELRKDTEALDLKWCSKREALDLPLRWAFLKEIIAVGNKVE